MATETLRIIIESKQKGTGAKQTSKGLSDVIKTAQKVVVALGAVRAASKAIEFAEFGARVDRAENALNNLAAGAGTSGSAIIEAIQTASNFTIDKMSAMESANKAMLLGVAKTPEEFARLSKYAVLLGRAMGQDATKSIDDFVVAAGRKSKMIADNLGLMVSATDANERYAKSHGIAVAEMDDAAKKQAFLQEMLRQAEEKTRDLEGASMDTAGAIEQLKAAAKDAGATIAQEFAQALMGTVGAAEVASESIRGVGSALGETTGFLTRFFLENNLVTRMMPQAVQGYQDIKEWLNRDKEALGENITGYNGYRVAVDQATESVPHLTYALRQEMEELAYYERASESYEYHTNQMAASTRQLAQRELAEAKKAMEEYRLSVEEFTTKAGMEFTQFYENSRNNEQDFYDKQKQLKDEHLANIAELERRGQSKTIKVDEAAEIEKLKTLQTRLDIALQSQAEFTEKTKLSTRMRKDAEIAALESQIADQEKLLDDYYNGRLVTQGENINGLLTAENTRYEEELRLLNENRAEQELAQRQSLGRMLLNNLAAWADLNNVTAGEYQKLYLMTAEKYGLIDERGRQSAEGMANTWTAQLAIVRGEAAGFFDFWMQKWNEMPTSKTIEIRAELATPQVAEPGRHGGETFQHGTASAPGSWGLVGDDGPEMMFVPRGAQIRSAGVTQRILSPTWNQTNNVYDGQAAAMLMAQQRQAQRRAFERWSGM